MLACIVYTMLATWSGVLMQSATAKASTPEVLLQSSLKAAICRSGAAGMVAMPDTAPDSEQPANPNSDCPVCKGLAACHLVLLAAAELGMLAPTDASVEFAWRDESEMRRVWITPRSRGPPRSV